MPIVYTCNTYFVMHWSMSFIWEFLVNDLIRYKHVDHWLDRVQL